MTWLEINKLMYVEKSVDFEKQQNILSQKS